MPHRTTGFAQRERCSSHPNDPICENRAILPRPIRGDAMSIFDSKTLEASRKSAEAWRAEYDKLVKRFGDQAPEQAGAPQTHSGLPIKSCYFPHDLEEALQSTPN